MNPPLVDDPYRPYEGDGAGAPDVDVRIVPPPPGVAVLACACGTALSRTTMTRRPMPRAQSGATVRLDRIMCESCAGRPRW